MFILRRSMSAFGGKAGMVIALRNVRFMTKADILNCDHTKCDEGITQLMRG